MILQTIACGRVDPLPLPAQERFEEEIRGPYVCREYPMLIARVRKIKRREAGEIVR